MRRRALSLPLAVLSSVGILSCSSDDLTVSHQEAYSREFIKEFGVVSRSHDWNLAKQASVAVTAAAPTDVRIFAEVDGRRYLFADYRKVSGTVDIPLTIPKGVEEVIVSAGGEETRAALGSTVQCAREGRTVADAASEGGSGLTAELVTDPAQWMVVPMLNATIFRRKMPENCYNAIRDGVHNDFTLKFKENDIIVRPLYWHTRNSLEFGLFYIDDDGNPVRFPIYNMEKATKGGDMSTQVLCWVPSNTKTVTVKNFMEDKTFMSCLADNGIHPATRTANDGMPYDYIDVNSLDNFIAATMSEDDKKMTDACCQYLESLGYIHGIDAPADKRYNYVYRWHFVGEAIKHTDPYGQEKEVWDNSFANKNKYTPGQPTKDIEIVYTYYDYDYNEADGWPTADRMTNDIIMDDTNYPSLISKGIKVHIDDITRAYGGYIKCDDKYYYSASSQNEFGRFLPREGAQRTEEYYESESGMTYDRYPTEDILRDDTQRCHRAVTWVGTKYAWRYMSFEDGKPTNVFDRDQCDFDMQDFVFILDGAIDPLYDDPVEKVVEPEEPATPYEWLIAAEDLGGTYDWDFNDLVAGVSCVSVNYVDNPASTADDAEVEYSRVTVTPYASGGTLPVYLMYTGALYDVDSHSAIDSDTYVINKEFHAWLGGENTTPLNVGSGITHKGESVTFYVPGDFSLAVHDKYDGSEGRNNMGGLWVLVAPARRPFAIGPDGAGSLHPFTAPEGKDIRYVTAPIPDDDSAFAPQMICVGSEWMWPRERRDIRTAYPESRGPGFVGWVADPSIKAAWYEGGDKHDPAHVAAR